MSCLHLLPGCMICVEFWSLGSNIRDNEFFPRFHLANTAVNLAVSTFFKKKVFGGHISFFGPLVLLFWISGDVSSGFQSQSGFCLIRVFLWRRMLCTCKYFL